jgi:Glycosyl hydrolases family 16.
MERLNHDEIAYQTIHTNYTYVLGIKEPKNGSTGKIDPNGYNTYAVEITPDSLIFSINDIHTFSYPNLNNDKEGQYPFGNLSICCLTCN